MFLIFNDTYYLFCDSNSLFVLVFFIQGWAFVRVFFLAIVSESYLVLYSNTAQNGRSAVTEHELAKHCYKWCEKSSQACGYLEVIPSRRLIGAFGCLLLNASDRNAQSSRKGSH